VQFLGDRYEVAEYARVQFVRHPAAPPLPGWVAPVKKVTSTIGLPGRGAPLMELAAVQTVLPGGAVGAGAVVRAVQAARSWRDRGEGVIGPHLLVQRDGSERCRRRWP
jgi:hypothetical protein